VTGRATLIEHLGDETVLHLQPETGPRLTMKLRGDVPTRLGEAVGVRFEIAGAALFGADGRVLQSGLPQPVLELPLSIMTGCWHSGLAAAWRKPSCQGVPYPDVTDYHNRSA